MAAKAPTLHQSDPTYKIRLATLDDIDELRKLIDVTVRTLHTPDYTPAQIEAALEWLYGVDTTLIADGNYYAVETSLSPIPPTSTPAPLDQAPPTLIACGGWSFRSTLYGGDQFSDRDDTDIMDPRTDPAKIRALFVHPAFGRRGIGKWIVGVCEDAAREREFKRAELGSTLSGVAFYRGLGYEPLDDGKGGREARVLENGEVVGIVRMGKAL